MSTPSITRTFDSKHIPLATIAIVVVNLFTFYISQLDDLAASTFYSQMFLHAGSAHLLINLLFLGLMGLMVEKLMGSDMFLGLYLAISFVMVAFALYFLPESELPGVGYSSAVSGLVGVATVIFGRRKISVFDRSSRYANALAMPVLMLLPLWVTVEFIQYLFNSGSKTSYLIHFSGYLVGVVLALLAKQTPLLSRLKILKQANDCSNSESKLTSAKIFFESGKYQESLQVLRRLYQNKCRESEVLSLYYQCGRMSPASEDFHRAACAIFKLHGGDENSAELIRDTYHDYVRLAQPGPRFTENTLFHLAELFIERKWCDDVDKIMSLMCKKRVACLFDSNLPYRYAKLLDEQGRTQEGMAYLKSIS